MRTKFSLALFLKKYGDFMKVSLIRPPQQSYYNDLDVREDNLISYFLGYCKAQKAEISFKIFDFVLEKTNQLSDIIEYKADVCVIFVRETGSAPHYALRLCRHLTQSHKKVIIYGQVKRFERLISNSEKNVFIIEQNEADLLRNIIPSHKINTEICFHSGFVVQPYFHLCKISKDRLPLFKASLESTRGCEFRCRFCYINYEKNTKSKWEERSRESILSDINTYYQLGIKNFVFMDSEFIGISTNRHKEISRLSDDIISKFPNIKFMVYSRADTLSKSNTLEKLKKAGLSNVFIGVESFFQKDLSMMKKGIQSRDLINCIKNLMDNNVYMTLSFITFNRYTTLESLKFNIDVLKNLHNSENRRYLGMPNFIFNMESSWSGDGTGVLSDTTYIKWLIYFKSQPTMSVVFNPQLEPLMEIYRILHYEITKKISELNYNLTEGEENFSIWYDTVNIFCLNIMEIFLNDFSEKKLRLDNIKESTRKLYKLIEFFYEKSLPKNLNKLLTFNEFNENSLKVNMEYIDHGWDNQIPHTEIS